MFSLHTEALCWLRYGKRLPLVCTEVGRWYADVLGMNSRMSVEVEIKKSVSDLQADFRSKQQKHWIYANADDKMVWRSVPNYFYFFTEEELKDRALEIIAEKAPKAGLVIRRGPARTAYSAGKSNVSVVKPATRLHSRVPSEDLLRTVAMRMSSQICGFRLALDQLKEPALNPKILDLLAEDLVKAGGILDHEDIGTDLDHRGQELAAVVAGQRWQDLDHGQRIRWIFSALNLLQLQKEIQSLDPRPIV